MYSMPRTIYPGAMQARFELNLAKLVANELPWMLQYQHSQNI
jgi:hypothetical protein